MRRLAVLVFFGLVVSATPALAGDWLQWGGPAGDFTVDVKGLAESWPADGPKVLWKRPLGEGYSSIVSRGDRLYTMYRDDEHEIVVALHARTGVTIWEHRYPVEIWPEMTRAFGLGPNATPLIVGDRLVSAGIDGQLRGLDLGSGELKWKHDLPAEYGRRERDEEYGYSASPLHYEGKVVVLVGGTDHAVVAFDPADGSTSWKSEPGGISYAAPTLTTLGGLDQFIYFSPQGVVGLDPATGRTLWHHPMEYNNGNHLTPIVKCDESHIWVGSQFPTGGGRLLEITRTGDTWAVKQLWFETNLRASHWTSIRIGDYIYGSTGGNQISLLTAFEWKTGKVAWRKRGFHKAQALYADGKLLFLDEGGTLTLARVSPQEMEVLASAQVTESISWTLPTLVGTRLYLRDKKQILALDLSVSGGKTSPRADDDELARPGVLVGAFGEFVAKVHAAENKKELLDEFVSKQKTFPIVEGEALVHFVFRGDVADVALMGNFLELNQVDPMYRIEGTDFYFRSYRLAPAAHYEYRFNVFEETRVDPLNPRRLIDGDDAPSVVTTTGWKEPRHLRDPEEAGDTIERFDWNSEILDNDRSISVWLPPGYGSSDQRYPLVLVNYGNQALGEGKWGNSLGNLVGNSVAPLIVAFIPRVDFNDYGPRVAQFVDAIEGELIPMIEERYRTLPGPRNRAMTGIASGGFASIFLALSKPELVGNVALHSFYFRGEAEEALRKLIEGGDPQMTRFYVEWSTYDLKADGLPCEEDSRELAALLVGKGYRVVTNEVADGAGWGSWRARTDRILEEFFPYSNNFRNSP